VELLYGDEPHHIVEALFKAFARATDTACRRDRASPANAEHQGETLIGSLCRDGWRGHKGACRALTPERGCVEDQPQQLRKTGLLKYA